jgi:hypothetical protein
LVADRAGFLSPDSASTPTVPGGEFARGSAAPPVNRNHENRQSIAQGGMETYAPAVRDLTSEFGGTGAPSSSGFDLDSEDRVDGTAATSRSADVKHAEAIGG